MNEDVDDNNFTWNSDYPGCFYFHFSVTDFDLVSYFVLFVSVTYMQPRSS